MQIKLFIHTSLCFLRVPRIIKYTFPSNKNAKFQLSKFIANNDLERETQGWHNINNEDENNITVVFFMSRLTYTVFLFTHDIHTCHII